MKKIDEKIVKEEFNKYGYVMIGCYTGNNDKILAEKDGYKFEMSYVNVRNGQSPNLFGKRNKYQKENLEKLVASISSDTQFLDVQNVSKSGKMRVILKLKCNCGKIFTKTLSHIQHDKYLLCYNCSRQITSRERKKKYNYKHIKKIQNAGYRILDKPQDIYALEKVEVEDIKTGYRGFIYPNSVGNILIWSIYHNLKNYIYNTNILIQEYGYKTQALKLSEDKKSIIAQCQCGKIYTSALRAFYKGRCLCPDCSQRYSKYALTVKTYLDDNNFKYIQEFLFNSCRDIYPLPFDFYLNDYNCLIEVDGEGHYKPIAFDSDFEAAQQRFIIQQKHDKIKNDYCEKWGIPLLRISYKEIKDKTYQNKLLQFIQTVKE